MEVSLIGGSSKNRFTELDSQYTANWIPIVVGEDKDGNKKYALTPTPGLTTYTTLPGRYIRSLFTARTHLYNKCFAVVDQTLYEITDYGTYTTLGTLTNMPIGSTRLFSECNLQNEVFFSAYDASYVYDMDTGAITQVTDQYFPNNVTGGTYLDQYTIVCANGAVFESLTTSMLNWSASQTYSPTFKSAPVIAVGATKEQIFNFTTETIEVYVNDGTSPYSRLPRTSMLIGIKAKDSLSTWDGGFVFLGGSRTGETAVYFYDGYQPPKPISDESVSWRINSAATLEDAYGWVQQTKNNQTVYNLTIPSLGTTLCYNFNSGLWFDRKSTKPSINADGTQDQVAFRGSFYTNFNGKNLFADRYSGKIFIEDYTSNTEDDQMIRRERISQTLSNKDNYISFSRMIIECNAGMATSSGQGSAPVIQMSSSDDAGHTFNQPRNISLGSQGQYLYRARLNNMGTARRRCYRIVVTDPVDVMLKTFQIDGNLDTN